jgi:signal transduction histidine kinase/ligand-binding sensor domain-containing protein/DNA-binding response OmpR family regulator
MRIKIYLLIISLFAVGEGLRAQNQNTDYQFSHLDITNGLSNNQINCIYKDSNGFMWFGTTSGLNRYDGYKFKVFKHIATEETSLANNFVLNVFEGPNNEMWVQTHSGISIYNSDNERFNNNPTAELARYKVTSDKITSIRKDRQNNFWFITPDKGIYYYNPHQKTTAYYTASAKSATVLHSNNVADIIIGNDNLVWFIYSDGVIDKFNSKTQRLLQRSTALNKFNTKPEMYYGTVGKDNNLWIYAYGSPLGVYCYNTASNHVLNITKESPGIALNNNVINSIVQGDDNNIWIGTDHGGINLIDVTTHKVIYLVNRDDDVRSLRGNCVQLYKDNAGIIWAGTYKQGISYYHKGIIQFPLARHYVSNPTSLPYEDVNCFVEDDKGNLWIGTNGGGLLYYNQATKRYTQFKHDAKNAASLSNNVVISLLIDSRKRLWIGTYFGGLERLSSNQFIHYRHKANDAASISDDRVYSLIEDSSSQIWAGTFAGGLNIYDDKTDGFKHPKYAMSSEYTALLYEDRQRNIWIARDKGVDVIEKTSNKVRHYGNHAKNSNSLISNDVNCVFQDDKGLYWISTKEGLSILNAATGKFININEDKGLPNNNIWNIMQDKKGLIWVSSANGIASIQLQKAGNTYKYTIKKYDEFDGLQGKEYNANSAYKTRSGNMIFGGSKGYNLFNPDNIHAFNLKSQIRFTDFQLFNKSLNVGDSVAGHVVLPKSITGLKSLVLKPNENVFSLQFAVCDYFNPNKITYQYKLEGFDKGWLTAQQNVPKATYTNLDAGDYVFRVRASNANDPLNFTSAALNIKVLPPFWKTPFAYALYALVFIGTLFYIRHRGIVKLKKGFALKQEKLEAERKVAKEREEARRMHELDLMKIKFFTNVSHEFRTPLSLIISPIDGLIKSNDKPEHQQQLAMIKRNGKRLLNLVNQLLDFRKMEFKELKLCESKGDIIHFIKDVSSSFTDLADQNQIQFLFDTDIDALVTRFDHDKIERILFNLLSNAFKFTASGGHISVFVNLVRNEFVSGDQQVLELKIIDTGIGIPKEKQGKIFEPFFQDNLPEGVLNQGSGIGLSISREFVKMHNGEISVESEPGNGTCFTILLPLKIEAEKPSHVEKPALKALTKVITNDVHTLDASKKPVILLVEDNSDMRFYLKDNLKHNFNIVEAVNGKDGWQKALSLHPDLIVSDVSMPEMNGIDLCYKIRHDNRTAHIPVILLTALIEEENQLAGTASGANDYITKPFNFEILLSKINGLLAMQQTLKKTYQKQQDIQAQDIIIVSEDQKFLKNTLACIEENITNPNFSVEELSRQMSLSRVSLYKRLLTLTGKTPVDCIRTIRLKRAVQLLEKSRLSIANVAYEVGFNNPTYFSKVFKEEYGTLPSEYVIEYRKREKELLEASSN